MSSIINIKDFIMGPLLGNALAGFDVELNKAANDNLTEAYTQEVMLFKPVDIVVNKYGRLSTSVADRVKLYISYSENFARFRLRVLLCHLDYNKRLMVFRRYKFQYMTLWTHDAERQAALDLIVKKYSVVYTMLRTTEYSRVGNISNGLYRQGFEKFTTK